MGVRERNYVLIVVPLLLVYPSFHLVSWTEGVR